MRLRQRFAARGDQGVVYEFRRRCGGEEGTPGRELGAPVLRRKSVWVVFGAIL